MTEPQKSRLRDAVSGSGGRLRRFIRARVGNEADAEDLLQDVWRQLAVALNAGPIEQISAWLYRVARNRIVDHYRKPTPASLDALAQHHAETTDPELSLTDWLLRDDWTPRDDHQRQLFWQAFNDALAELPAEQRQVFVWHELEDQSFQEIAARTGENLNTLLSRKRYAVLHLRRRLAGLRTTFSHVTPPPSSV